MSIETAINDLRNGYGNEITPKQLKERHDLSNDDLKEICQQNPDITVLMHVRRPPAPKPTEPGLKPSWSMEQVCERMSVKSFMAVMVRSFEANLRNMVATLGDMLNESDLPECHMDIPEDICKLGWDEWPAFHARAHVKRVGGQYKFEVLGEWDTHKQEAHEE